ncbi:MAG: NADPH:quinone reductase [Terriglobia bacterium]
MRAIRVHEFGAPQVMRLEEVQDLKPAAGQVLVRVKAVGVNPVDAYVRAGGYAMKPAFPYTPGADAAGTIEAVGPEVTGFQAGDRVYTAGTLSGAYAELALSAVAQVHRLPDQASFEQGAALGVPYATAYRALFHRAHAQPGETVLVHGASGGVGIACVELARADGMTVTGTAGTERGLKLVTEHGAHHVIDHHQPNYLAEAVRLTGGQGFDVILEMLANVNLGKDLEALSKFGRVVVIGSRGKVEIDPRDTMGRDAAILGMTLFNVNERELASIHAALIAGLENGTLRPATGKKIPLAEAPRAHEAVMEPGSYGKVILVP